MPAVYRYFDLREFLHDDFAERKARNPSYSLRAAAAKLGINSGTMVRIMQGKRNVGRNLLPRFIAYCGLRTKEAEYFRHLASFSRARTEQARMNAYRRMLELRRGRTKEVSRHCHAFYEEWYITALREVLRIHRFEGDYHRLAAMLEPPITVHEARRAIQVLLQLGFIVKSGKHYEVREADITTGERWEGAAIHRFQQQTIRKALEALERFPKEQRDMSTMTMCCSPEGFRRVRELLKRTRQELSRIEEADRHADRVYQINLDCFPLSRSCKGECQ